MILLSGCGSPSLKDYQNFQPTFHPETFFSGQLTAHGILKNRQGKVIRTFNANIEAWWEQDVGYLDEMFVFNDGERQTRLWKLEKQADGTYRATAGDVIGIGKAEAAGNAFNLQYQLEIDYNDSKLVLNVDDWMWLVSDNVIINHSTMTKFGLQVASIELTIIKQE